MKNEYISRQAALDALPKPKICEYMDEFGAGRNSCAYDAEKAIEDVSSADVVPYSIEPDGTLTVTVPKGTKRIGRILIEEDGTQYGGLFYPDTGGCFLSSMERSE